MGHVDQLPDDIRDALKGRFMADAEAIWQQMQRTELTALRHDARDALARFERLAAVRADVECVARDMADVLRRFRAVTGAETETRTPGDVAAVVQRAIAERLLETADPIPRNSRADESEVTP